MKVLVAGGSGLIGAHVVDVLRERGHTVTTVARAHADHVVDLGRATDAQLRGMTAGQDGVVYAARTDEQRPLPKPAYPVMHAAMVGPVTRLFAAAREEGVVSGVLMGSYYTYFDRLRPEWRLTDRHPYIRGRVAQAREARSTGLPVAVIELPFVFGRAGDRLPNWSPPLARWARSGAPLFAPGGGTAAVSARGVAETAVDALDRASSEDLPVSDENLSWRDLLTRMAVAVGRPRTVHRLPAPAVRLPLALGKALLSARRLESGTDPRHFARLALTGLYIEPLSGRSLGPAFAQTFQP
ncbi:NAD-dependent epimerase/dehydratase family protein [Catenuloplanes japonicus]|uniref:NAD-dependent epimerase/dehydratase family protein n=1 Tax=Catenuloplanes japonicus TaxID=33876 RepID=UPI000525E7BA|nr:NAD(P)-dependent oxidoreductase [Catenuloplanes japonicus]